ncbi:MAG: VOC family protein [Candidatus Marinimicrobia bacterium]|nr:VOC family protein [Candidatus Neomarinimicrobiota bacterium]
MSVTQLDHLNLSVHNFKETVEWYQKVFDFMLVEKGVQDGNPWGVIQKGSALLCIYEHPDLVLLDRFESAEKSIHYLAHFGLRIDNLKEWEKTIERENIVVMYEGPIRWPKSLAWYIKDPTGWEIEVALWDDNKIKFEQ